MDTRSRDAAGLFSLMEATSTSPVRLPCQQGTFNIAWKWRGKMQCLVTAGQELISTVLLYTTPPGSAQQQWNEPHSPETYEMSSSMVIESHVAAQRPSQTSDQTLSHHIDTLCYRPCRIVARHWRVAVCVLERSIQSDARRDSPLVNCTAAPSDRPSKTKPIRMCNGIILRLRKAAPHHWSVCK